MALGTEAGRQRISHPRKMVIHLATWEMLKRKVENPFISVVPDWKIRFFLRVGNTETTWSSEPLFVNLISLIFVQNVCVFDLRSFSSTTLIDRHRPPSANNSFYRQHRSNTISVCHLKNREIWPCWTDAVLTAWYLPPQNKLIKLCIVNEKWVITFLHIFS